MLKKISMNVFTLLFAMTYALAAQAQFQQEMPQQEPVEVSDAELDVFIEGLVKAQQVQNESQMKMIEMVEEDGLGVEKFNEIHESLQMGTEDGEVDATPEEMASYEELSESIYELQMEADEQITAAIEEEGMEMPRFQEILAAVQTDPALQQQIQQKMQPQGQPQPPTGN